MTQTTQFSFGYSRGILSIYPKKRQTCDSWMLNFKDLKRNIYAHKKVCVHKKICAHKKFISGYPNLFWERDVCTLPPLPPPHGSFLAKIGGNLKY
jgi:hypothetical protein